MIGGCVEYLSHPDADPPLPLWSIIFVCVQTHVETECDDCHASDQVFWSPHESFSPSVSLLFLFLYISDEFVPCPHEHRRKALKHHRVPRPVGCRYTNCSTLKWGLCIHQEIATSCTVFQVCAPYFMAQQAITLTDVWKRWKSLFISIKIFSL